jgi:hypothetical protein
VLVRYKYNDPRSSFDDLLVGQLRQDPTFPFGTLLPSQTSGEQKLSCLNP